MIGGFYGLDWDLVYLVWLYCWYVLYSTILISKVFEKISKS